MSTGAISGLLGNSYVYTFSKSDFKSVAFNTTDFAVKSFLGNLFIIASGLAVLSLLPENAFCSLRGNCRGGQSNYFKAYNNYQSNLRNKYVRSHHHAQYRTDEDIDEVEYIDRRMGLPNVPNQQKARKRMPKRLRRPMRRSKRDSQDYETTFSSDEFYDKEDLSTLPAEHRQSSGRNPVMNSLVELFFGNPIKRVANGWYDVYQHYEDYWRFRLRNPGQSYRRYLKFRRRGQQNNSHIQSRQDEKISELEYQDPIDETKDEETLHYH